MHARYFGAGHGLGWFSRFVALATAGLAAALVTGCDNSDAIPIDDLGASVETAYCRSAVECGGATDQASCEAAVLITRDSNINALVAAVKRGTIVYDGKRARACLDEFGRECIRDLSGPPSCEETFRGTVPDGGSCHISNECIGGSCTNACAFACCLGTCAGGPGRVVVGGDCSATGAICVQGAYCKAGKCAPHLPFGAACSPVDVCRRPGNCIVGTSGVGTCIGPPDHGAPCDPSLPQCLRSDDYCDPVTRACVTRKAPGVACAADVPECAQLAPCINGVCTPHPTLGQPCVVGGFSCLGALVCTDGVCATPPDVDHCAP